VSRFQFVEDHQDTYEVKRLCELVEVARSSYYAWRASRLARGRRAAADAALTERIHLLHRADPTMGVPRTDRRAQRHCPRHGRASEP